MSADKPGPTAMPQLTPQAEADRNARLAREAEALRANLRRRKDQSRARTEPPARKQDDPDAR